MKIILSFLIFVSFTTNAQKIKRERCFMIGYIADTVYSNGQRVVYSGGEDTCMTHFPNLIETLLWIEKKHHCETTRILGITEYTKSDRKYFWKSYWLPPPPQSK